MNEKRHSPLKKALALPLLALVYIYKYIISPVMPGGCRHYPSCSIYAIDALKIHGPGRGSYMALNRILRCHPWGTHGIDPVPLFLIKKVSLKKYGGRSSRHYPSSDRLKH